MCLSVLVRTRLGLRADIAEKYVLLNAVLQVPQHCEACRGKELAAILLFVFMVPQREICTSLSWTLIFQRLRIHVPSVFTVGAKRFRCARGLLQYQTYELQD